MSAAKGIDRLLQAEQDAQKLVEAARKDRTQKLKLAHEASQEEIKQYKIEKEKAFNELKQKALSGTDDFNVELAKKTDIEIKQMQHSVEGKAAAVVSMLVTIVSE